jgi:hypothetical protein
VQIPLRALKGRRRRVDPVSGQQILNNLAATTELVFWSREQYANIRSGNVRFVPFFLLCELLVHHVPDQLGCGSSFVDMGASQFGVTFGHLDIRVLHELRQLVEVAAVHHLPGCKGMTQIVEPEVMYVHSLEQVLKTSLQSLTLAARATLWGKIRLA